MVDLEKINGKYEHAGPVSQFTETAGKFACDLLELSELQAKLFKADARAVLRQSIGAIAMALIGCTCLLGCIPVVVFGLASAVTYFFEIEAWVAQLLVGGGLALLSFSCVAIAFKNLSRSSVQFRRSTQEFSRNLEWTKDVIRGVSER